MDANDKTDIWVSDRAITRVTRSGSNQTVLHMIDAWVLVVGSAEQVIKQIEDERRAYGS